MTFDIQRLSKARQVTDTNSADTRVNRNPPSVKKKSVSECRTSPDELPTVYSAWDRGFHLKRRILGFRKPLLVTPTRSVRFASDRSIQLTLP